MSALSLSLRFNGHSPGEPGLAGVYWSRGWWKWWWQLELYVVQSSSHIITTNKPTPSFLQAGCPSWRPTNSVKALKGKYHILWTCLPRTHLGVFQLCLWPLVAPGYLGEGWPCLSSALWCQYPLIYLLSILWGTYIWAVGCIMTLYIVHLASDGNSCMVVKPVITSCARPLQVVN